MNLKNKYVLLFFFSLLMFHADGLNAQTKNSLVDSFWSEINLASSSFKIPISAQPLVYIPPIKKGEIGINGGISVLFPTIDDRIKLTSEALQSKILNDVELYEKLFEKLGGEFFIGDFKTYSSPNVSIHAGINGGYHFKKNLKISFETDYWKSKTAATFPISIIKVEGTSTTTSFSEGKLKASLMGLQSNIQINYYLKPEKITPFFIGGISLNWLMINDLLADIDNITSPIDEKFTHLQYGINTGFGLRSKLINDLYLNTLVLWQVNFEKNESPLQQPNLQIGFSYRLGRQYTNGN